MLVTIQNMKLLFSPCKQCCACPDAVLRSFEEALAGIILHRPPSLWFAWVCSADGLGARGPGGGGGGGYHWGGGGPPRAYMHAHVCTFVYLPSSMYLFICLDTCNRSHRHAHDSAAETSSQLVVEGPSLSCYMSRLSQDCYKG